MDVMGWPRRGALAVIAIASTFPITASAERVVYVDLEQTTLINTAGEDPTMNSHNTNGFVPGTISGWPELTEDQRAELIYYLHEGTVPFDITFTYERPAAGEYDMLVFGTAADNAALFPDLGCSPAIGLADCADMNGDNIGFVFPGCMAVGKQDDMERVAFNALVALGFGWGLENLEGTGQVMAGWSVFALHFGDECTPIDGASQCEHMGCGDGQQNSTTDLTAVVGARVDDGPPVVTIVSPENLAIVEGGVEFVVEAEITDKFGGLSAELEIVEGMFTQPREDPPFVWEVNLPATNPMWTLRVSGTDADGNVTTEEVVVCVDVDQCDVGAGTGSDTDATGSSTTDVEENTTTNIFPETSDGSGEPVDTGTDEGPIDPTADAAGFDIGMAGSGCHCRSGDSPISGGLLLLALFGLSGRRRLRVGH
jgi:hypothetical protein